MNIKQIAAITTILSVSFAAIAADEAKLPPASEKKDVTFAADIKPILEKSCVKCHGAEKPKARLRLDSLAGVLKGSKEGKVVVVGKSEESQIVKSVAHVGDPDGFMPPLKAKDKFPKLTPEQVGLIRAWIDQGAK
jgi:mono/diheme cytochrome c family protein